jgi:hypothetical protein
VEVTTFTKHPDRRKVLRRTQLWLNRLRVRTSSKFPIFEPTKEFFDRFISRLNRLLRAHIVTGDKQKCDFLIGHLDPAAYEAIDLGAPRASDRLTFDELVDVGNKMYHPKITPWAALRQI